MNKADWHDLLERLSGILIRCFFLSFALLLMWGIAYFMGGDVGYSAHSKWFQLSRHEYDLVFYCGMAFIKTCALLFFLFPYLSIRLLMRKKGSWSA